MYFIFNSQILKSLTSLLHSSISPSPPQRVHRRPATIDQKHSDQQSIRLPDFIIRLSSFHYFSIDFDFVSDGNISN